MNNTLRSELGNIDIYLFDQLLKGRYDHCETIIDIGCGGGRNIVYFLKNGFQVYGIDQDANAIEVVKAMSQQLSPANPIENFRVSIVEDMPFQDSFFDLAICSAVLHFAKNKEHFDKMLRSIWRILKPGGFLFARLASDIGIETLVKDLGNGRYLLPDGSQRFLVNQQTLEHYTDLLNAELYEPIKTTNVSNTRCMTTWCIRKL
jgi:ubiquinone/menaquinone biosynthesis C-methylase UbiE